MDQIPHPQQHLPKTDEVELPLIGIRKYENLKSLKPETLTESQKKQIEIYESKQRSATPEQIELQHNYFTKIHEQKEEKKISITSRKLWELFKSNFEIVNKRGFVKVPDITIKNLEPLIYYFSKDNRFFECENLSKLSHPSFDKGLLIVGTFGNGKTSTMKVFEKIFKGIPEMTYRTGILQSIHLFTQLTNDLIPESLFLKTL
jgi:DNA replication protein DnaC